MPLPAWGLMGVKGQGLWNPPAGKHAALLLGIHVSVLCFVCWPVLGGKGPELLEGQFPALANSSCFALIHSQGEAGTGVGICPGDHLLQSLPADAPNRRSPHPQHGHFLWQELALICSC